MPEEANALGEPRAKRRPVALSRFLERAIPKRAPPSGGAARLTAASRPVTVATAAGSWGFGTTALNAPADAAANTAPPAPSTNATTGMTQKTISSRTTSVASVAIATALVPWAAIMSRRRLQWSAASPAGNAKIAIASSRAEPTKPAFAAEPVRDSTSNG
jgi:hypothetical protein